MEVWENEKCFGNMSRQGSVSTVSRVLPNFHMHFNVHDSFTSFRSVLLLARTLRIFVGTAWYKLKTDDFFQISVVKVFICSYDHCRDMLVYFSISTKVGE